MILAAQAAAMAQDAPPINLRRTVTVEVVEKTKGAVVNVSARKMVNERRREIINPFMPPVAIGPIVRVPADSLGSGTAVHMAISRP